MRSILLIGAGKIGSAIARLLADCGDYQVLVADADPAALRALRRIKNLTTTPLDATRPAALRRAMKGRACVISATSFHVNPGIAQAALDTGISYFDLTEDRQTTHAIRAIARTARPGQIFMPQCGLAPGFVSIAACHLSRSFDRIEEVAMRVGALPQFPTNEMKYNLTWSTDGLINEYGNPCQAIHQGKIQEVLPLEGLEHFSLDGVDYEAFNTSGGVGTLCQTLAGKVRTLNYKTVRYRGHRDLMAFLLNELRLNERRPLLKDILENAVPITPQDEVLIFCTVTGFKSRHRIQITDARKIYQGSFRGRPWSAIQLTTAASLCAVLDLHLAGRLPKRGFVRQEQVPFDEFLANRFGCCYEQKDPHGITKTEIEPQMNTDEHR